MGGFFVDFAPDTKLATFVNFIHSVPNYNKILIVKFL